VGTQVPGIAELSYGRPVLFELWNVVRFVGLLWALVCLDQKIDLGALEACDLDIEVKIEIAQLLQLDGQ
jgi:hypothetical protein